MKRKDKGSIELEDLNGLHTTALMGIQRIQTVVEKWSMANEDDIALFRLNDIVEILAIDTRSTLDMLMDEIKVRKAKMDFSEEEDC